jgi:hypothetical protein
MSPVPMNPRAPSDCAGHDLEHWSLADYLLLLGRGVS